MKNAKNNERPERRAAIVLILSISLAALLLSTPSARGEKPDPADTISKDHRQEVCQQFLDEIGNSIVRNGMKAYMKSKGFDEEVRLIIFEFEDQDLNLLGRLQGRLHAVSGEAELQLIARTDEWNRLFPELKKDLDLHHRIDRDSLPGGEGKAVFNVALFGSVALTEEILGATLTVTKMQILALESGDVIWSKADNEMETVFQSGMSNRMLYTYMGVGGGGFLGIVILALVWIRTRSLTRRHRERKAKDEREKQVDAQLRADRSFRRDRAEKLAQARRDLDAVLRSLLAGDESAVRVNNLIDSLAASESNLRNAAAGVATRLAASPLPQEALAEMSRLESLVGGSVERAVLAVSAIRKESDSGKIENLEQKLTAVQGSLDETAARLEERNRIVSGEPTV